ncbi:MAG: OmpA family protein [Nitrospirae bacterium]|nr:OmpA family protein [Nitrospirota bacterium]
MYGIEFDTNRADLKAASAPIIAEIAKLMIANPNLRIYVVGHTDNVGTLASNLDLSLRRAKSVVKELVTRHKIAGNRLSGQGVGPLVPVATNGTDKGRARNRRVDLVQQ